MHVIWGNAELACQVRGPPDARLIVRCYHDLQPGTATGSMPEQELDVLVVATMRPLHGFVDGILIIVLALSCSCTIYAPGTGEGGYFVRQCYQK